MDQGYMFFYRKISSMDGPRRLDFDARSTQFPSDFRVLLVDDDESIAKVVGRFLKNHGCENLSVATSAQEAFLHIENNIVDLILMDIGLQGPLDGITAVKKIKKIRRIPVIYTTGTTDKEVMSKAIATDPYGFLCKPFVELQLFSAIRTAMKNYFAKEDVDNKVMEKTRELEEYAVEIKEQKIELEELNIVPLFV